MAGPGACYTDADLEGKKKDSIYHQVKEFLDTLTSTDSTYHYGLADSWHRLFVVTNQAADT